MPNLARVRTVWSGVGVVGGGVSTFYFDEAHSGFVADVGAFWSAMVNQILVGTVLTTAGSGDLIDIATGEISGTWSDGAASTVTAAQSGNYAAGVGARVTWATSGIRNGRRVRGSTFVVPLTVAAYDNAGTLAAGVITALQAGKNALLTGAAGNMRIYSRPGGGLPGMASVVIDGDTPDKVSWLRTRRT